MLSRPAGAIEKLADMKLKAPATSMLLAVCEAVGPQFVALQLHKKAAAHKNPKVWAISRCGWCRGVDRERILLWLGRISPPTLILPFPPVPGRS